jgi:hypothetical protein
MRVRRIIGGVAAISLLAVGGLAFAFPRPPWRVDYAGTLPDAAVAAIPRSVDAAESEGARWAVSADPSSQLPGHTADFATPSPRRCVEVDSVGPVRSGEFFAGGILRNIGAGGRPKLWWRPMHPTIAFNLTVRGARLDSPPDTLRYEDRTLEIGGRSLFTSPGPFFYSAGVTIPSSGRWLVVATSGPDWGCFILPGPLPSNQKTLSEPLL